MKKFTTSLLLLLVTFCFILTGCSSGLSMPTNYENIASNGGFVVGSGNYMFFANAYKDSVTDISETKDEKVSSFVLNRLQLEEKQVQDENGLKPLNLGEDSINYEKVATKIAGYKTSNMYVVGKYLYFTSPNVHKNDSNAHEFNLSSLFRIGLDGNDLTEICTTESEKASFYLTGGGKAQILIFDNNKIKAVEVYKNSTDVKTLASDVESTVFPKALEQEIVNIYFTKTRDSQVLTGNLMYKLNLVTNEVSEVSGFDVNGQTIKLIAYESQRLFYTKNGKNEGLYSNDFSGNSELFHRYTIDGITSDNFEYIPSKNTFVFTTSSAIYTQNINTNNDLGAQQLVDDSSNISFVNGTHVYYTKTEGIFRISVLNNTEEQISDVKDFNADLIDFDGRYIYFYAKVENASSGNQYLYRADTYACADEMIETEIIGKLSNEDVESIKEAEESKDSDSETEE